MTTNWEVIQAWVSGRTVKAKHLSTDGYNLYSYALLIGQGRDVFDYTSRGLRFVSQTTSTHVGLAKAGVSNG